MLVSFSVNAAREVSQVHLEAGDGNWSVGVGFRKGTFPYIGQDKENDLLPLITYNGKDFFIDGTRTGFHLLNSDDWLISTYAAYRFGGFNEEDSMLLDGMDRDDGVDGRLAVTRKSSYGSFTFDTGADISNKSEGWDAEIRWGELYQFGNYRMRPWLSYTYEDQNLSNYYYGVNFDEVTFDRPSYQTTSSKEWSYGLDMSYRIGQHHFIGLNLQYSQLDESKINSPIVTESGVFHGFLNYRYEFNDFQSNPYVNGSLTRDLTKGEWYWRFAAGRTTTTSFNQLMRFIDLFDPEERNTGLASFFLGKKVANKFMGLPIEAYVTGGYVRRFERGEQEDFNEYVLGFKAYYSGFPWSDKVKTRVGIGQGVSYAQHVPIVEKENVERKNRSASHFLNYLDWSWDVSIGDIFGSDDLKDCFFGWSVHHRSGIFGSSDFYGNVDGGGNVNTLYMQCHHNIL